MIDSGATPMLWPVLASAAVAGLASGVHCVGMCGGIVGALSGASGLRVTPMRLHLGYSLGRIASYALAGALAGGAGQALGRVGAAALGWHASAVGQHAFMLVASMMLVLLGLHLSGLAPAVSRIETLGAGLWRVLQPHSRRLLPADTGARAIALGAVWGFLPCGLVYAMLATAFASGSAAAGAAVMLAFGLGTLPNLLAVGYWLTRFRSVVRAPRTRLAAGLAVCAFGLYGIAMFTQSLLAGTDPHAAHHPQASLSAPP